MSADVGITNECLTVNTSSETPEDIKNVLFQLKTDLSDTPRPTSEPTVPFKSSSEILSELFGAFNAEPPKIPDNFQATEGAVAENLTSTQDLGLGQCDEILGSKKIKSSKVSKRRKHKHKTHKHKKRSKKECPDNQNASSSSDETRPSSSLKIIKKEGESSVDKELCDKVTSGRPPRHNRSLSPVGLGLECRIKKEKVKTKHKTKSHRKLPSSAITVRSVKFNHAVQDPESSGCLGLGLPLGLSIKISNNVTYNKDPTTELISSVQTSSESSRTRLCTEKSNDTSLSLPEHVGDYESLKGKIKIEPGTEPRKELIGPSIGLSANKEKCGAVGQPNKTTNKISIKSLKFSSVFEATVREVEEQAKAKADRYEEGEISNSDCDELVLSPISSIESDGNIVSTSTDHFYITREEQSRSKKSRKRHHSTSHHHSSKRRKKSSASEKGLSVLLGHSHKIKHSRSRNEGKKVGSKKQRDKHRHVHNSSERHSKKSSSCSLSPEPVFVTDSDKKLDLQKTSVQNSFDGLKKKVTRFSGKKTVEELTDFCKELSRHEQSHNKFSGEDDEDYDSDSETERPFHHPFQVKERPQSIVVNIRNSIQLPVKSFQEKAAEQSKQLRLQFPVSSGQHHRKVEDKWVPVSPKRDCSVVKHASKPRATDIVPSESVLNTGRPTTSVNDINANPAPACGFIPGVTPVKDIGSIVSQKLRAMRTLQENPNDVEALGAMFKANQDMLHWAEAKQNQIPPPTGAVATSTVGATVTSTVQGSVAPTTVSSGGVGMGMSLLQKMGWRPGEGLGKNREGTLEPLKLEIKMDKKGLITAEDLKSSSNPPSRPTCSKPGMANRPTQSKFAARNINQAPAKHPINQLVEFCMRNRWKGPQFELCHESGPDHRKNFLFKVLVNGTEYKPMVTSLTKKQAKTEAAGICLQALRDLRP